MMELATFQFLYLEAIDRLRGVHMVLSCAERSAV